MANKSFQNVALFVVGISIILYVFLEILGTRFWEAVAENLAFIFLPACFFAVYCDMRKVNTWNETLQHIGIPLGILVSTTSFLSDLQNIEEVDIMLAVAKAFYSVLYGGVLAGFGYLISLHSERDIGSSMAGRLDLILLMGASIIFFLLIGALKIGLGAIPDVRALTIFLIPFLILAIALQRDNRDRNSSSLSREIGEPANCPKRPFLINNQPLSITDAFFWCTRSGILRV